ncbi:NAD(P)H-binding protein [Streptomyces sp. NPDC057375]|uniref:NAD(P)H-binding protein n=1 Tax=Streptomyces sp. NPDC057375 TaxID=3346109 RepID=UPI00363A8C46
MSEILVTGATGNVGREIIAQFRTAGTAVRALVRNPESFPSSNSVQVVAGDLSQPDTLEKALAGFRTVFLIWPFLTTERAPAVLKSIAQHADRVVYLSSSGVNEDADRQTDPINQLHADMERLIIGADIAHTILRSDTIASNARGWAEQIRTTNVVRGPEIAPTAVIHERDVAAVAVRALTDDRNAGATYVLTGPEVLSREDQVRTIGEVIGRRTHFEPVPLQIAREQMLADGRPPALVEALVASAESRPASRLVTRVVEKITGAPARTFRSWANDHADIFI